MVGDYWVMKRKGIWKQLWANEGIIQVIAWKDGGKPSSKHL
jgi:hypothetical protein